MTIEQVLEETRKWPLEKVSELVGRIEEDLHSTDPHVEAAWKEEVRRRIQEAESGAAKLVPADVVFAKAKTLLGE